MKVVVFSLGCKVNQYEGQSLVKKLRDNGVEATDALEKADCYVINTCSVTLEADKKSRQAVARVLKLNPNAKVIICGCSSQNDPKKYENKPNISVISGVSGKMSLFESIMSDIVGGNIVQNPPLIYEDDLTGELTRSRGFIKVQDGCNNFCSYCIIPYLRGRSRSRKLTSIIDEATDMSTKTSEIVITGINVSAYGKDIGLTLLDLVKAFGEVPVRKRFGSLECTVITDELLMAMRENDFCPSFHLSMQSGSDTVLKRMNRHYTKSEFLAKCELIRKYFPDAGITTDIIVGFPGESDEEFNETLLTCKQAGFFEMHVFPYSVRPGTVAAKMEQVDKRVALERSAKLREVAKELKEKFLLSQKGKIHEIFIEEEEDGYTVGHAPNYVKTYTHAPVGSSVKQKFTVPYKDGVKGEDI